MKILIATRNYGKLREMKDLLSPFSSLDLYSLHDFPDYEPPEETQDTFEQNATLKAVDASKRLGIVAIADDSGLVVPALQGRPGVHSRRFASLHASDSENRAKLIEEIAKIPETERSAHFFCALAVAANGKLVKLTTGQCEGQILDKERGTQGFGYDSLFLKYDYHRTFAELDPEVKNRVSHRRKAFDKLHSFFLDLDRRASCGISSMDIM